MQLFVQRSIYPPFHPPNAGDGAVGIEEFRFDCVNRNAYRTVDELNQAYEKLLTVSKHVPGLQCLI